MKVLLIILSFLLSLFSGGGVIAACGLLMLLLYKGGYKREGEDIVLRLKAMDLDHSCRTSLMDYLAGKDVEPELNPSVHGGIIRLEVYCNAEAAVAYAHRGTPRRAGK